MSSGLMRRGGHDGGRVAFIELFFDLVFVFAITQLSHALIGHFSLLGALQTALMLLAVWWVWMYTTWITNWLDPEKLPVRSMLMVLMVVGMVLSASIPHAFDSAGLAFALAYVGMQVGRTLFMLWALGKEHPVLSRNFTRILIWFLLSAPLWIAGGLAEGETRLWCWIVALAIDYSGPAALYWLPGLGSASTREWTVNGHHMAERCGLFIIIALGESILVTGATFSHLEWTPVLAAAFSASFLGSLAMWWLYFDTSAEAGTRNIVHSDDAGAIARLVYTYMHLLLVAGIILLAAADEFVLAHPEGHSDAKVIVTAIGGAIVYLLGNACFKWGIAGHMPRSSWLAMGVLLLLVPFAPALPPWLLMSLVTLTLILLAAWERKTARWCPATMDVLADRR